LSSTNPIPIPASGFTSGGTYISTPGLVINATTGEINLAASTAGIYTVTYSVAANAALCLQSGSSTFSINVTGSSTPNTAFTYTSPICKNALTLSPNIPGTFTAGGIYSGSSGLVIDANTGIINLDASSAGSHTITYVFNEDVINCISSGNSTFNITINDVPFTAIITGRTTICPNENGLVFSTNNVSGVNYNWSISGGGSIINGQGTNQITANWGSINGTVSVELSNSCGSSIPSILNVEVGALPQVSFISGDTTICANEVNVVYSTNSLLNTNFIWSVPVGASILSGQGTNQITVNFTSPSNGVIKVVPSNSCGNGDTLSRSILVTSTPFLELGPDEIIVLGSNLILTPDVNALQPVVYSWASNPSLSSNSIANPTASPTTSSTYYLTITDGNGCSTSDSKTINVESNNKFYIPNAFSPNGDSNNDLFNAFVSNYKFFELNIYNRWGEKIYSTNEPNTIAGSTTIGWDGKFKDLPQPIGVYVYILKLVFSDNTKVNQAGSVTLIR
jgi:gliding motility-associated-like protein